MVAGQVLFTSSRKKMPPSKALYSIQEQIDDLRVKEVELERAKLDFYKKAEEQRYQSDLDQAKRDFEA